MEELSIKILFKYETNLNNSLIIHLDLCLGSMKECNVRLIYNIQLGWMFSWKPVLQSV
jgi:hypothetical protein